MSVYGNEVKKNSGDICGVVAAAFFAFDGQTGTYESTDVSQMIAVDSRLCAQLGRIF